MNPTFDQRFREANDWCVRGGYAGGYPTCHQANYGDNRGTVHGVVALPAHAVEWRDVPAWEMGNPNPNDHRLRLASANGYAYQRNYLHGFPNFHHANYGQGTVYGTLLVRKGPTGGNVLPLAQWQDVPVQQILGKNANPNAFPIDQWFRGAHLFAINSNLWAGAMPTGHSANYGGQWVMGVVTFRAGIAHFFDVPARNLGFVSPPGKRFFLHQLVDNMPPIVPGQSFDVGLISPDGDNAIAMSIKHGSIAAPPLKPWETTVHLSNISPSKWDKQIDGWSELLPVTSRIEAKWRSTCVPSSFPPKRFLRPEMYAGGPADYPLTTLVFRKQKLFGEWHNLYHWDPALFWKVFGGRVVEYCWVIDAKGQQLPVQ